MRKIILLIIAITAISCSDSKYVFVFKSENFKEYSENKYMADKATCDRISCCIENNFIWYNVPYDIVNDYEGKIIARIKFNIKTKKTEVIIVSVLPKDFKKCVERNLKRLKLMEYCYGRENGIYDFIICIPMNKISRAQVVYC